MSPKALRWLHRVGYVATAIVVLQLVGIGTLATAGWLRDRSIRAAIREDTRTRQGPLSAGADGRDVVADDARALLAELPPLGAMGPDALRFVAMPSFGRRWFALAVRARGGQAEGVLVSVEHSNASGIGAGTARNFGMPLPAYRSMVARADRLSDGWGGDSGFWLDGTPVAFERARGTGVTSGIGNSGTHYGKLAAAVRDGLAGYVPEVAALDEEWMARSGK